jgi:flagellar protein FliS
MHDRHAIDTYRAATLENAPPIKIVRLLYQSAIARLERAQRLDPRTDGAEYNAQLSKADAIVAELRFALDPSVAPQLTGQLEALYLFCEDRIGMAFGDRDGSLLGPVVKVLRNLLEAWEQIELQAERAA